MRLIYNLGTLEMYTERPNMQNGDMDLLRYDGLRRHRTYAINNPG